MVTQVSAKHIAGLAGLGAGALVLTACGDEGAKKLPTEGAIPALANMYVAAYGGGKSGVDLSKPDAGVRQTASGAKLSAQLLFEAADARGDGNRKNVF